MTDRITTLLAQMTLPEKIMVLAGAAMWSNAPIPRLGIPRFRVTDGPNGARGGGLPYSTPATCFPAGVALAATWNVDLVAQVGQALGQEARSKHAQVLLAPTMNIHRSPLNGRSFECFSEDPYLTARMAVAYITGVQSQGVGATPKHFVCNDSEFERMTISSEVGERALREIYLAPFQTVVREAQPWVIMAAYNKLNGVYASENAYLLNQVLREEWGFTGLVMSDWYGTRSSAAAINAGLDVEMPGPSMWRGELLLHAVEQGEVEETTIDMSVRRVLALLVKAGCFTQDQEGPEQTEDRPEHRAITRRAAAESIVLLKNERQVLPLQTERLRSIAIIGPNAKEARIQGGGSAGVNPHYVVTPFDAISARLAGTVAVGFAQGCTIHHYLPLFGADLFGASIDDPPVGIALEFFDNVTMSGAPVAHQHSQRSEMIWFGAIAEGINPQQFSVRGRAHIVPQQSGVYTFGLISVGQSRLLLDGREIIDNWNYQTRGTIFFGLGTQEETAAVPLSAGQSYVLTIEFCRTPMESAFSALRVGCLPPQPADALAEAAHVAAAADVALVFGGLSAEWECEGYDRPTMGLVGDQDALIARVAAANPNTIVVLNSGAPLAMPWCDQVAAVVQAWYPGQECGNAIADVLFGDVSPSGKLPMTFPIRLEDTPAFINYPGENGRVHYGEGLFVGYRYYEKKGIAPLFPFGHGRSYTTFTYGPLHVSAPTIGPDEVLTATVELHNSGPCAGQEVVQLYVRDVAARLHRPEKELKGFAKVALQPDERRMVTLEIPHTALAYYDDLLHQWIAEAGEFTILVGSSSQDIRATATVTLTATSICFRETRNYPGEGGAHAV